MPQMNTIAGTVARAKEDGYPISEYTLRQWLKKGKVPSVRAGQKYLIYYPNLLSFLQKGEQPQEEQAYQVGMIRKLEA